MTYLNVMNRISRRTAPIWMIPVLLFGLVVLGGCENEELLTPEPDAGPLFARYVAIGNSITAGFQSGGINVALQEEAYPVLIAAQMGTEFVIPRLNMPGCPPPLTQVFPTPQRLGGASSSVCALRALPPMGPINNVAVPAAEVVDVVDNLDAASNSNALTTFILGGRTQLEAALAADPTFVSIWIGNNDVLGAATAGNTALLTDPAAFQQRYTEILDGLESGAEDLQGGLLFSVGDVTLIPNLSPGVAYLQAVPVAQQAGVAPPNLAVANSCAPSSLGGVGDQTLVPFQHGATLLQVAAGLFQQLGQNAPTITLDCAQDRTVEETVGASFGGVANIPSSIAASIASVRNISILTGQEIGTLRAAVQQYNQFIESQASQRGWAFLDVNALFDQFGDQIPLFPEIIDNPQTPWGTDQPFGPLFSLDGVHPSSAAHRAVAGAAIQAINAKYGTNIPALPQ